MVNHKELQELLTRGVTEFVDPEGVFEKKLKENPESIVIKFGVDPTRPDLHLGHAVVLRKLRAFQDLGCKVIFLIGDYTTMIGDPTGKSKVRPELAQDEIEKNMNTYLEQVGKILRTDEKVFSWIRNSDWFLDVTDIMPGKDTSISYEGKAIDPHSFVGKAILYNETRMQKTHLGKAVIHSVSFSRVLATLRHITHARLIERDMFQARLTSGTELYMHEMLYPVLQGIDSTVLASIYGSCDLEVGGSDQTFNMLIGRDVMRLNKQEPQAVLAFSLLTGLDGKEKMSKSLDNYISVIDTPHDMYGKIMSVNDEKIREYFELCTYTPREDIETIERAINDGSQNPRDSKMRLAREIVALYHGEALAQKAEEDFITKFQKNEIPDDLQEVVGKGPLGDILVEKNIVESKTEWRRLVAQGAVTNLSNDTKVTDATINAEPGVYRIGKHRFIKIV
jgi:tyrosyl-tRNA synthetase